MKKTGFQELFVTLRHQRDIVMKLAFLISAHTDPKQLHRLTSALPSSADCYVHIDLKSDISDFVKEIQDSRVHFIENRQNVVWGSLIETKYQMELVRACLASGVDYDYLITLSGLDYPVWSNSRIEKYFEDHKGLEILQGCCIEESDPHARGYQEYRFFSSHQQKSFLCRLGIVLRIMLKHLGIKKPLVIHADGKSYKLYKGAAWWAISPKLASLVLREWDTNKRLVHYFKSSFCPAETFTQTVAFNSELARKCLLAEGPYKSLKALTPLTYIDYSPVIKILTEEDYDKVIRSDKMFCRKTMSGKSDHFIVMLNSVK